MKRNGGIIGPRKVPNLSETQGIYDVYDNYIARKDNAWPKRKVFISCTPNVANHYEGETKNYTIIVDGFETGNMIYYTYSSTGGTVNSSDFVSDFSGSLTLNSSGQATLSPEIARDADSEGSDTFEIEIRKDSTSGTVLGSSGTITIPNATYTLTPSDSTPDEGTTVTMTLAGSNTYTGTHYYSLTGTGANVVDTSTNLTGSFSFDGTSGTFPIVLRNDWSTEGNETLTVQARVNSTSGPIVATSTLTIQDTSLTPIVSISESATSVNEGSSVTFTLSTTNFPSGTLTYRVSMSADMEITDVSAVYGEVSISSSSGSFSITATSDGLTETGQTETFQVKIYNDPDGNGALLATSATITINDTSTGSTEPTYEIYEKTYMAICNYKRTVDDSQYRTSFMVTNDEFANVTVYDDQSYIQSSGTQTPSFTREFIWFKGYWGPAHRWEIGDLSNHDTSTSHNYSSNQHAAIDAATDNISACGWSGGLVYDSDADDTNFDNVNFNDTTTITGILSNGSPSGLSTVTSGYTYGIVGLGTMLFSGKGYSGSGLDHIRMFRSLDQGVTWQETWQKQYYSFGGFLGAYPDYNGGKLLLWTKDTTSSNSGPNSLFSSSDGVTWTDEGETTGSAIGSPAYRDWRYPVYNKDTQKFYHTNHSTYGSGSSSVYESADGVTWTTSGSTQYNGSGKSVNNVVVMPNGDMLGHHQNGRFAEFYRFARSGTSITWNTTNLVNKVAITDAASYYDTYYGRAVFGPYGAVNGP